METTSMLRPIEKAATRQFLSYMMGTSIGDISVADKWFDRRGTEGVSRVYLRGAALGALSEKAGVPLEHIAGGDLVHEEIVAIGGALADAFIASKDIALSKDPASLCQAYGEEPTRDGKPRRAPAFRAARFARMGARAVLNCLYTDEDTQRKGSFSEIGSELEKLDQADEADRLAFEAEKAARIAAERAERKLSDEAQAEIASKARAAAERGEKVVHVPESMAELKPAMRGAAEGRAARQIKSAGGAKAARPWGEEQDARDREEERRERARRESNRERIDSLEKNVGELFAGFKELASSIKKLVTGG
jgi:hypothetical protein